MKTASDLRDERMNIDAKERDFLRSLARAPYPFADRRTWTNEMRSLRAKGLIFHALGRFSITPTGEEVLERVS